MNKKLLLVEEVAAEMAKRGVTVTPNAVRERLRASMLYIAEETCDALGIKVPKERLRSIAGSRMFQEAVAAAVSDEDQ